MARLRFSLDDSEIAPVINRIRERTADMTPLMQRFQMVALDMIKERFRSGGPGWKKHSPATEAKRGKGAPILLDKADLWKSMTGGTDSYLDVGPSFMEVGTTNKYAAIHNFGGKIVIRERAKRFSERRSLESALGAAGGLSGVLLTRQRRVSSSGVITIPERRMFPNEEEIMPKLLVEAEKYLQELIDAG